MKRIFKYILITILMLPVFIDALTYNDTKSIVNTFISRYDDYDKYFLNESGAFLTKEEYELSKVGHYSYLATGTSFWLVDDVNNKVCTLSDTLNCTNPTSANAKVTQNIKPTISVTGSGSQSDPWEFIEIYKLYVNTNDVTKGKVEPSDSIKYINSIDNVKYTYTVSAFNGYEYLGTECSNGKSFDKNANTFVIENINEDTSCKVKFGSKNITVTLDHNGGSGDSLIDKLYHIYNVAWYSDNTFNTKISKIDNLPSRTGYSFAGYYTKDSSGNFVTQIIDNEGNIISYKEIYEDSTIYAKWNDINSPTCKLKVTTSGVVFESKTDNEGVTSYGINKSTTASYGNDSASLSTGTFYGHVKDAAGNSGVCSATISSTYVSSYTKKYKSCTRESYVSSYDCRTSRNYSRYCPSGSISGVSNTCHWYYSTSGTCSNNCSGTCYWGPSYGYSLQAYVCADTFSKYYDYYCSTGSESGSYCYLYNQSSCGSWSIYDYNYSYNYYFTTSTSTVYSCSVGSSFSCNSTNYGYGYTSSCTASAYSCSSGTKLNNSYCYVIN